MGESNFCSICGQRWSRHSSERCDEIAEQLENEADFDEDVDGEEILGAEFGSRLDDGFRMMSDFDDG